MLNKLIQKKTSIFIIYAVMLFVFCMVTLIFGNREDKLIVLVLSFIIPVVVYGFVRLMYKIVSINASVNVMRFFYYFFLIGGLLGAAMMFVEFIYGFPNGLSPAFGTCGSLLIATLDSAKKQFEN